MNTIFFFCAAFKSCNSRRALIKVLFLISGPMLLADIFISWAIWSALQRGFHWNHCFTFQAAGWQCNCCWMIARFKFYSRASFIVSSDFTVDKTTFHIFSLQFIHNLFRCFSCNTFVSRSISFVFIKFFRWNVMRMYTINVVQIVTVPGISYKHSWHMNGVNSVTRILPNQ